VYGRKSPTRRFSAAAGRARRDHAIGEGRVAGDGGSGTRALHAPCAAGAPPLHQHDRPGRRRQQLLLLGRQLGLGAGRGQVPTMTANGLAQRCLRSRSRATAAGSVASQAR
jgi:hypothetical protein